MAGKRLRFFEENSDPIAQRIATGLHKLGLAMKQQSWQQANKEGLSATKIYRFKRDSYVIDVALEIRNTGPAQVTPYAYFQLTHDGKSSADANAVASGSDWPTRLGTVTCRAREATRFL